MAQAGHARTHAHQDLPVPAAALRLFCLTFWFLRPSLLPRQSSVLVIRPSAALACSDCVQEAAGADGTPVLEVPPGLTDAQLLPLLEPYRRYRVWRLSLEAVGGPQRAFGGFADAAAAAGFDQRMERITGQWCCRWVCGSKGGGWSGLQGMVAVSQAPVQHVRPTPPPLRSPSRPGWCRRREEELVRYHKQDQQAVKLRMNSQFKYSDMAAGRSTT